MRTVKQLVRNPLSLTGMLLLLFFLGVAVAAPWLAPPARAWEPYRIIQCGFSPTPAPPGEPNPLRAIAKVVTGQATLCQIHPFGTTGEGQYDIYYGVVWGTRTAFQVGLIITGACVFIGVIVGSVAAYFGRWVDEIIMRITDIFLAFPFLVAAMTTAAVLQPKIGRGLITAMIALICFGWMTYSRLIRGDILAVKEREYVQAARAAGAGHLRIIFRHILPNTLAVLIVQTTLQVASAILSAAALGFLGLGVQQPTAEWGAMLSTARQYIQLAPHTLLFPGLAIMLTVLGFNLFGDGLRDALDPRLRA